MGTRIDIVKDTLHTGVGASIQIPVRDQNGNPKDLTGLNLKWQVRLNANDAVALVTKTSAAGIGIDRTGDSADVNVKDLAVITFLASDSFTPPSTILLDGKYHHALIDDGNDVEIAFGDFWCTAIAAR